MDGLTNLMATMSMSISQSKSHTVCGRTWGSHGCKSVKGVGRAPTDI